MKQILKAIMRIQNKVLRTTILTVLGLVVLLYLGYTYANDQGWFTSKYSSTVPTGQVALYTKDNFDIKSLVEQYPEYVYQVTIHDSELAELESTYKSLTPDKPIYESHKVKKINVPTRATVVLNHTSITRQYGNQQSFTKNTAGYTKNEEVFIENPKYPTYEGWFWNRSHLIADSLGGPSEPYNAITGTRPQNVGARDNQGGMRLPESRAYDYIHDNPKKTLLYDVIPLYFDTNDLVPYAVQVTLYNGDIKERYITLNIAYGYQIDYKTGKWEPVTY